MTGNRQNKLHIFIILRIINTLSLDVVLGAVMCALFVSKLLHVNPGLPFWILLPVAVWIIYTLDHLIDANRLKSRASTFRHRFHFRNRKVLVTIIVILSMNVIIATFYLLDKSIIIFGVSLSIFTTFYLAYISIVGDKANKVSKEFIVSVIYTCGVWGGPLALINYKLDSGQLILLLTFFIIVLADVLLLSYFEKKSDKTDKHNTIAVKYGEKTTRKIIIVLLALVFGFSIYIIFNESEQLYRVVGKLYLLMAMILTVLITYAEKFRRNEIYRYIIEALLLIPGLVIIY